MDDLPAISRRHRILRVLGQGGMGVVYEAEDLRLGRRVALKVLSEEASDDRIALARLRREALSMGALQHPHIVQVSDFDEGPPPFLEMEILRGQSLRDRLEERGPMRPVDACSIALQLLSALGAAHRAGIVHRDVKPANVFVVETPLTDVFVKLLDFGIAKLMTPQRGPALTRVDSVVGSAAYMAPEQIRGETIDGRTDLFSLGVTLYEMLSGRRPFAARPNESVMATILRGGPIAPLAGMPAALENAVLRAFNPSPSSRYASAEAMGEALLPFVSREQLGVIATTATRIHAPASATRTVAPAAEPTRQAPPTVAQTLEQTARLSVPGPSPSAPTASMLQQREPHPALRARAAEHAPLPARSGWMFAALGALVVLVLGGAAVGAMAWTSRVKLGGVALAPWSETPAPRAPRAARPAPASTATIGPVFGSCKSESDCTEYTKFFTDEDSVKECKDEPGVWREAPCVRTGTVGGCRYANGGITIWYFPPTTKEEAKKCPGDSLPVSP